MTSCALSDPAHLPCFADVAAAAQRLAPVAVKTPILNDPWLDRKLGFRLLIKAEPLQRTGSFKFRGAYNKLVQMDEATRARGVVAFSSGNHAQGVAAAAQILGIKATIVMPADAPAIKLAKTRAYGATVVTYDRMTEDREAIARRIQEDQGASLVPPYDDRDIMAGQGTAAFELIGQATERGFAIDAFATCVSGGGLLAGSSLAFQELSPRTRLYSAEPVGFDDHARSFAAGSRITNEPGPRSFCDALLAPTPGLLTFAVNQTRLAGGIAVTDRAVEAAMRLAFDTFKLVVEPGGAVALAAAITGQIPGENRTVAVIASGGNVDPAVFCAAMQAV